MTALPEHTIPTELIEALDMAHPSWRPALEAGLEAMMVADPGYLPSLTADEFLPNGGRLFAAFGQPIDAVRFVLVGEGPYPRAQSATGVSFMDGAVDALWSEKGLSKQVNRATSLRNFIKMLLVVDGLLLPEKTSGDAMQSVAVDAMGPRSTLVQTRAELQGNLTKRGFLLLNASLVFRPAVPPLKDARAWRPFLAKVLQALAGRVSQSQDSLPTLVLWGKVAELIESLPEADRFPKAVSEHPYNLTFIANPVMHSLFKPMQLLRRII